VLAARWLPRAEPRDESLRSQIDGVGAGLLGIAVLAVLLPIIEAMSTPLSPWWLLVLLAPAAAWTFVRWERRVLRRGGAPLLDVRLFSHAPGYASGIVLGTAYFCGFSGLWLVLALYLQDGLGLTPLQSGLTVTPFAIGSAIASISAGRVIIRLGRRVTVVGLVLVVVGFVALALVVPATTHSHPALWLLVPLFVAGIGGGATISPNITMTLSAVPPRMGGAAGGALQTGQRIGSAIGAAVLTAAFRLSLSSGVGLGAAVSVALVVALAFTLLALVLAVRELRIRPTAATQTTDESDNEPQHAHG
jgi:nitrate/nitrite transporter NarK